MKTAGGGGGDDRIREAGWQRDGGDGRILDGRTAAARRRGWIRRDGRRTEDGGAGSMRGRGC